MNAVWADSGGGVRLRGLVEWDEYGEVSRSLNDAPRWNGKSRIHTLDGLGTLEGRNMATVLRVSKRHPEQGSVTRTRKNGEPIERRKG